MFHFFNLVKFKVAANLKVEVSRYYLNWAWWVLEPAMTMMVFYVIFGIMLKQGTENYVAFLLTGITPWIWFNRSIMNSSRSIYQMASLIPSLGEMVD